MSSTIAEEASISSKRRNTALSTSSGFTSPILEREPTWRVEDHAKKLHGYPKLATFLSGTDGYAIYKRFASLNARNLLYHQAKLTRLEHELHEMEMELEQELHYRIDHIFHAEPASTEYQLRKKYEEVSLALEKYNRLLLDQRRLHELPEPDSAFVNTIHDFIKSEKTPKPDWLQHPENTVYAVWEDNRKPVQTDLVTLNPEFQIRDPFTKFFTSHVLDWFHKVYSRFKVSLLLLSWAKCIIAIAN